MYFIKSQSSKFVFVYICITEINYCQEIEKRLLLIMALIYINLFNLCLM